MATYNTTYNKVFGPKKSSRIRALGVLWMCIVLLLAGCSTPHAAPKALPDLHLAHVSKMPGSEQITAQSGVHQIDNLSTYRSADPSGKIHVLALVSEHVYDIGLDGTDFHEIPLPVPCARFLSVTHDGQWGVCQSYDGIEVFGLSAQAIGRNYHVFNNPAGEVLGSPSWAPDGRHLAVVSRLGGGAVAIYSAAFTDGSLLLTACLTLSLPYVDEVSWSPDGEWLAVSGGESAAAGVSLYMVHINSLESSLFGHEAAPVTIAVAPQAITSVSSDSATFPLSWPQNEQGKPSSVVTAVRHQRQHIVQRDLSTGGEMLLIAQQAGYICDLSWATGGQYLVFVLCGPPLNADFVPPPAQIYVYTPPS